MAASGVEQALGIDHTRYALLVFALPLILAALIEAPVALLSDRVARTRVLALGLGALSASLAICALAERGWLLSLALAGAGAASGIACGAAQAELISAQPGHADRALSRWTAFASAGDACAPLLVAALAYCGRSHRAALAAVAGLTAAHALLAWRAQPAGASRAAAQDEGARANALQLARSPRLWLLLFAAACCTLLDEIAVALAALHLHDDVGCSQALAAALLTAFSLGGLAGALAAERLLHRFSARRVLLASALLSVAALALFIAAPAPGFAACALLVLGAAAAPQHPLAQAAAFELVPARPGLVQALAQVFVVLEALIPLVLGAIASCYGLPAALAALVLQPLVMVAVALSMHPRRDLEARA